MMACHYNIPLVENLPKSRSFWNPEHEGLNQCMSEVSNRSLLLKEGLNRQLYQFVECTRKKPNVVLVEYKNHFFKEPQVIWKYNSLSDK